MPDLRAPWQGPLADAMGFEVRLGDGDDRLDIAFLVPAGGECRSTWTAIVAAPPLPHDGLTSFFASWSDPASVLHAHVPHVWLEFDQHRDGHWPGPPFVTFAVDPGLMGAGPRPLARLGPLVHAGLTALVGAAGREVVPSVLAAAGMLPEVGRLAHLAAMPHRGTRGARAIFAIPVGAVRAVLRRMGWPGDGAYVEATLRELWPHDGFVSLDADLTPALAPRLGVELFRPTAPIEDAGWDALLDGLERRGHCSHAKRVAIAAWPTRRAEAARRRAGRLERHLLVKLVFDSARLVEAKGYLAVEPRLTLLGPPAGTPPPSERAP